MAARPIARAEQAGSLQRRERRIRAPQACRKGISDVLAEAVPRARPRVLLATGDGAGEFEEVATIGHNFEAVVADLETRMRAAAADLDFEEAARLRDEIKRLRSTELAVTDDPTAKFLPAPEKRGTRRSAPRQGSKVHKPALDEMGIALHHEVAPLRPGNGRKPGGPHKPTLGEMGPGVESVPGKSSGPRSTLGRPGMRGGLDSRKSSGGWG